MCLAPRGSAVVHGVWLIILAEPPPAPAAPPEGEARSGLPGVCGLLLSARPLVVPLHQDKDQIRD